MPREPSENARILLVSSVLHSVSYDAGRRRLRVWFRTGLVYEYFDVPPAVVKGVLEPPDGSHGRAFNRLIRDRFEFGQLP